MIENLIFQNLIYNEGYSRKVIPYIKEEYFSEKEQKVLWNLIKNFVEKYNSLPTKESLVISLDQESIHPDINEKIQTSLVEFETNNKNNEANEEQWLLDRTEEFCQEKAIYNAVLKSIEILDKKSGSASDKTVIPSLLSDALGVTFDSHIGHDYFEDAKARFDFYHQKRIKIPFDLSYLNKVTDGGVSPKTLNLVIGFTNVGKSLFFCHLAASYIARGLNVLYITLEMAEEWIAKRIDANLFNIPINNIDDVPWTLYESKIEKLREKIKGKLIIKEFPTTGAGVIQFKNLVDELKIKKKFKADIIIVDYLNICSSSRIKMGNQLQTYSYIKSISEELRGLAVEEGVPLWSGSQINREAGKSSDHDVTGIADSIGTAFSADFIFSMITTEDMEALNQIMFKQQKNRYDDVTKNRRGFVGIDRSTMKLYDLEDDTEGLNEEPTSSRPKVTDKMKKFSDLKFD